MTEISGFITASCLREVVGFGEAVAKGERRNDVLPSIVVRSPIHEYRNALGIEFGLYADFSDTIGDALVATTDEGDRFLIYTGSELGGDRIEDRVFWVHFGEVNTILLSDKLPDGSGERTVRFKATAA